MCSISPVPKFRMFPSRNDSPVSSYELRYSSSPSVLSLLPSDPEAFFSAASSLTEDDLAEGSLERPGGAPGEAVVLKVKQKGSTFFLFVTNE